MRQKDLERINWYRTPIDKDELAQLTKRSDLHGSVQTLGHLGLVAVLGAASFYSWYHWHPLVTVALIWLYGTVACFLGPGAAGHELSHFTVFKTRWMNEAAMKVTAFLVWFNYPRFRQSHRQHHQFTVNHPQDLEVVLPGKMTARDWLYALLFDPLGWVARLKTFTLHALGRFETKWEFRIYEDDPKAHQEMINWARVVLLGHAVLAAVFIYFRLWPLLILVTACRLYANWFTILCGGPQHLGMKPNTNDFRLGCRSMDVAPLASFLYWRMQWHIEHHMYAGVPFYNLPKLRRLVQHDMPPAKGLLASWREINAILRRQKQEPDYCAEVHLPQPIQSTHN